MSQTREGPGGVTRVVVPNSCSIYRKTFCLRGKLFWGYCNRYRDRSHSIAEPGP